jgi:hypothetical protein
MPRLLSSLASKRRNVVSSSPLSAAKKALSLPSAFYEGQLGLEVGRIMKNGESDIAVAYTAGSRFG